MTRVETVRKFLPLTAVVTVIVVALALLVSTASGRRQLQLSYTDQPSAFTELYFRTGGPVVETTEGRTTVNFSIRSLERESTQYNYTVTVSRGGTVVTSHGSALLRVGERVELSPSLDTGSLVWQRVAVSLDNRVERISWQRTKTNELVAR